MVQLSPGMYPKGSKSVSHMPAQACPLKLNSWWPSYKISLSIHQLMDEWIEKI